MSNPVASAASGVTPAPGAVDCCVHPVPRSDAELGEYLPEPYRSRLRQFNPSFGRNLLNPPFPEYLPWTVPDDGAPGSDPEILLTHMDATGVELAILSPMTKGMLPDPRAAAQVASAFNQWLVAHWLDRDDARGRFLGAIRISARDAQLAVTEIERWADDDRFVQVTVSMEALAAYGQQQYFPIWEAAAAAGLPVMLVSDRARGVGFPMTPLGDPRTYLEAATQLPFADVAHLTSLIADGVFDRLPELRFILADGNFGTAVPILWRVTNDWRGGRFELPWVQRPPIDYLAEHVRFVVHPTDGPPDPEGFGRLVDICGAGELLMFGSRFPYWDTLEPESTRAMTPSELWEPLLRTNALTCYRRIAGAATVTNDQGGPG